MVAVGGEDMEAEISWDRLERAMGSFIDEKEGSLTGGLDP